MQAKSSMSTQMKLVLFLVVVSATISNSSPVRTKRQYVFPQSWPHQLYTIGQGLYNEQPYSYHHEITANYDPVTVQHSSYPLGGIYSSLQTASDCCGIVYSYSNYYAKPYSNVYHSPPLGGYPAVHSGGAKYGAGPYGRPSSVTPYGAYFYGRPSSVAETAKLNAKPSLPSQLQSPFNRPLAVVPPPQLVSDLAASAAAIPSNSPTFEEEAATSAFIPLTTDKSEEAVNIIEDYFSTTLSNNAGAPTMRMKEAFTMSTVADDPRFAMVTTQRSEVHGSTSDPFDELDPTEVAPSEIIEPDADNDVESSASSPDTDDTVVLRSPPLPKHVANKLKELGFTALKVS